MTSQQLAFLALALAVMLDRGRCQTAGVIGTSGGNSNGRNCVFPFSYRGITYNNCVTVDNKFIPWCATTSNYDIDRQWGRCILTLSASRTKNGNANGANCVFPFLYRNQQYFTCITNDYKTNKPWCATTANYDIERRWGECIIYPLIQTTGGNGGDVPCQFPFRYQGEDISGCIQDNIRGSWCATTSDFDRDGQWGQCVLSFTGCTNTYQTVSNQLSYGGIGQSSTTQSATACQQICDADPSCLGFDYDNAVDLSVRCYIHREANAFAIKTGASGVDQYILTNRCNGGVVTFGGNAGLSGTTCSFPYLYRGRLYTSCNSARWYGPWCSTTSDYDLNKRWGECANIPTV